MDPPRMMMNDATFQSSNEASFSMAEIWKFPVNAGCVNDGDKLELRKFQLEQSFGQFEGNLNVNRDVSIDDPMVLDQRAYSGGGNTKRHDEGDSGKGVSTSSGGNVNGGNGMNYIDIKRLKTLGSRDDNDEPNDDMEANSGKRVEKHMKPAEQPKQDYIHVRARRGQATDSHSLAERARREKISERMRILQDLVPGCNKVIGKALVLDEIINYIQSLQRQVEFLSMKLEAVNSRPNPSMEGYSSSDFGQHAIDMAGVAFGSQASKEYNRGSSPDWLHMQIGGGFERT